jgi:hypothetical protein
VEGRAEGAAVPGEGDQRDGQHGQQQPAPLGDVPAGQTSQPEGGGERRAEHGDDGRGDGPARRQPGVTEVEIRHPVARAAQQFGRRHGGGGGVRLLDVRHEVLAVDAQKEQRHRPPGGRQHHPGQPPGEQLAAAGALRAAEQIQADWQQ